MNRFQFVFNIVLIFVIAFYFSFEAHSKREDAKVIKIRNYTVVRSGSEIKLSDLINSSQSKKSFDIKIGDAPKFGEKRVFTNLAISQVLRKKVKNFKAYRFKIPSKVVVEFPKSKLTKVEIEQGLLKIWQQDCLSCELKIKNLKVPTFDSKKIQAWNFSNDLAMPKGRFNAPISIKTNKQNKTIWVSGELELFRKVPVASRNISYGEPFSKADFEIKLRNVTYIDKGIANIKSMLGRKLKRTVSMGQIIWPNDLQREKAIRRGDIVQVKVGDASWSVVLKGKAQQDAYIGDVVNIKNISTKKVFSAKATGFGEALVE